MDKVLKYHIDTALYTSVQTWVMNKTKYEAMSPAQKKVIDDHCTTEWALKIATPWADFEAGGRDKIKAMAGQEVYPLTSDQFALWRAAAQPLIGEWAEPVRKAGYDPKAALDELKASAAKYNSAY
jgi:TRAP-type transport system periplasmic protein